jgi:hypothetical protein
VDNAVVVDCDLDRTHWWRFLVASGTSPITEGALLAGDVVSPDASAVESALVTSLLANPTSVDVWHPLSLTPAEQACIWENRYGGPARVALSSASVQGQAPVHAEHFPLPNPRICVCAGPVCGLPVVPAVLTGLPYQSFLRCCP